MTKQEVSEQTSSSQEVYVKMSIDILFNRVLKFELKCLSDLSWNYVSFDCQKTVCICSKWQMEYLYD